MLRGGDLAERPAIPVFREPKLLLSAPIASAATKAIRPRAPIGPVSGGMGLRNSRLSIEAVSISQKRHQPRRHHGRPRERAAEHPPFASQLVLGELSHRSHSARQRSIRDSAMSPVSGEIRT